LAQPTGFTFAEPMFLAVRGAHTDDHSQQRCAAREGDRCWPCCFNYKLSKAPRA
jgi:hypothetical protein